MRSDIKKSGNCYGNNKSSGELEKLERLLKFTSIISHLKGYFKYYFGGF